MAKDIDNICSYCEYRGVLGVCDDCGPSKFKLREEKKRK